MLERTSFSCSCLELMNSKPLSRCVVATTTLFPVHEREEGVKEGVREGMKEGGREAVGRGEGVSEREDLFPLLS